MPPTKTSNAERQTSNSELRGVVADVFGRSRTVSFLSDELSAGSFDYCNDLVEALITAQRIPARI
jgi:hypothetical protein